MIAHAQHGDLIDLQTMMTLLI